MTDDTPAVTDVEAFEERLQGLLQAAHRGGVSIEGGWEVDGVPGAPTWDVVVTVVERGSD